MSSTNPDARKAGGLRVYVNDSEDLPFANVEALIFRVRPEFPWVRLDVQIADSELHEFISLHHLQKYEDRQKHGAYYQTPGLPAL